MWIAVRQRFSRFHANLNPTPNQLEDGFSKMKGVGQDLERAYNGQASENPPVFAVGSWGKGTQVRPSADIDVMALLDWSIYERFHAYAYNGQSALLREIKEKLEKPHPQTIIRGDGQVVMINFNTILVEVVPVFSMNNGQFIMPDTHEGGSWKIVDPFAQINHIDSIDRQHNGNVRALSKIIKRWKHEKSAEIKSYLIELMVADFVQACDWGKADYFWYDWLVRDCFKFMLSRANGNVKLPGTNEVIQVGSEWVPKVETALRRAELACEYEKLDADILAGEEWQKIFGDRIAIHVL